jgi:hypothetical protein
MYDEIKGKIIANQLGRPGYEMSDERPKRDSMSREEATVSNMWEIRTIL